MAETKKKYSIVTYLFGGYEILREPEVVNEEIEYVVVTDDRNITSENWKVVYLDNKENLTPIELVWIVKYHPQLFCEGDYILRIDGSIQLKEDSIALFKDFEEKKYDLGIMHHPIRNVFSDEYDAWVILRGMDPIYKTLFFEEMENCGFDIERKGLVECTVYMATRKTCETVMKDIYDIMLRVNGAKDRLDQCWFTYILESRYHYLNFKHVPEQAIFSKYMRWCLHGKKEEMPITYNWYQHVERGEVIFQYFNGKKIICDLLL